MVLLALFVAWPLVRVVGLSGGGGMGASGGGSGIGLFGRGSAGFKAGRSIC